MNFKLNTIFSIPILLYSHLGVKRKRQYANYTIGYTILKCCNQIIYKEVVGLGFKNKLKGIYLAKNYMKIVVTI